MLELPRVLSYGLHGDALAVNEGFGANYGGTVNTTLAGGGGRLILASWPAATRRSTPPPLLHACGYKNYKTPIEGRRPL